jgi:hypothetical protein
MNEPFKQKLLQWAKLADFLRDNIQNGTIPEEHRSAVNAITDAEHNGMLYALEALNHFSANEGPGILSMLTQGTGYSPLLLTNMPHREMVFDNYVGCDANKLPIKLAQSLVKGSSYIDILFLHGDSGQGKTHLLCSIANEMKSRALYTNVTDLGMEISRATQLHRKAELFHWLYEFKALLLDDFEYVSNQEDLQDEVLEILKGATVRNIPVIISSTRKLSRLPGINTSLFTLLSHAVSAELQLPDRDQLRVIAEKRAGNTSFPTEVIDYLTEHIRDNVHHLVGAIKQIVALSEQTDTPISIDLARAVAPMETDLQSQSGVIPNLEPALESVFAPQSSDGTKSEFTEEQRKKAEVFKEMLASAQNEEEQCLALQIALSERIKELRTLGETEEISRLKVALVHLRDGKIREALNCTTL